MNNNIERITLSSKEVLDALNILMPQMSPNAKNLSKKELEKIVRDKNIYLLVLRNNTRIVASATLAIVHTPSNVLGFVEDVVVDEEFRGNGYGRLLVQEIINVAKKSGVKQIKLQSNSRRAVANILYKKLGFVMFETNSYQYNIE